MTVHSFGGHLDEYDDVLDVQGVHYPMTPIGLRAMRKMLNMQRQVSGLAEGGEITDEHLDLAVDIVVNSVRAEYRDQLREQIEESVPPNLLIAIATAVMGAMSDVNPTQPESSSDGSTPDGSTSTAGVLATASTPGP